MGCDIHLYFEKKNANGEWEKIEIDPRLVPYDRYYPLFGFLAGVRDHDITAQFADRGIPDDSSIHKKLINEDIRCLVGDYGYTFATLYEILQADWKKVDLHDTYFYIFCAYTLPLLTSSWGILSDEDKRNIRVVMGFDN